MLPVNIIVVLVLAGLRFHRRSLILGGALALWILSTPLVGGYAMRATEGWAERGLAKDAPAANAIVVLSGGRISAPGKAAVSEWTDADRFFGGVELMKANKAPMLIFTGAMEGLQRDVKSEGSVLAEYAKTLGVPDRQILLTSPVENTADEAKATVKLLRERLVDRTSATNAPRVLLVTSAFHMNRARHLFERAGMIVIPFPVDFKIGARVGLSILDFLPSAAALQQTELAWREWYGRIFYVLFR